MQESFYKPEEWSRETRHLPAEVYNLAHTLLARAAEGHLFVPIRSMQYLAILDADEFVFVDREGGRMVEIAWRRFRPDLRAALGAPVQYEAVYYIPQALITMKRLQVEFHRALKTLAERDAAGGNARVIDFPGRRSF